MVGSVYQGEKGAEGIEKGVERCVWQARRARLQFRPTSSEMESTAGWTNPAVPGKELKLTIDARLQFLAERELAAQVQAKHARSGTVIVMNPYTGEILALANYPTFDPNKPPQDCQERRAHFDLGARYLSSRARFSRW